MTTGLGTRTLGIMSRVPSLSSSFLLGFDEIERALDRAVKASDGCAPYNIERIARENGDPERLRVTLAVAECCQVANRGTGLG